MPPATTEKPDRSVLETEILLDRGDAFPVGGMPDEPVIDLPHDAGDPNAPMTQKRVLGLAVPIIGENLLQTLVGAIDTFMVARLGSIAVAGVGTSVELIFFLISMLSAVEIGATVLVSQAIGAGDTAKANQLARQALSWGVLLAIPVSFFGVFVAPHVIRLYGAEPAVADAAVVYLEIIAATSVALLLSFVCSAVLRGAGDSRTPLYAAMVANVVNIVAAYALIFGNLGMPALGIAGSAWAASLGRAVAAAIMIGLMVRGHRKISLRGREGWMPHFEIGRSLMRLGVPAAIEQMLISAGFATMMGVVAFIGTAALAAQQIGFTALSLAFLPGFGFAIATTALVGQSVGANNWEAARKAQQIGLRWGVLWMACGSVVYFFFGRQIMHLFTSDPEVIDQGVRALRALSIALPFWGIGFVSSGALRGSGDTRTPAFISASSVWVAVALAWFAVHYIRPDLGLVWSTFVITSPISGLLAWALFRRRMASLHHQP